MNKIFKQNAVNITVFKLQLIFYSTVKREVTWDVIPHELYSLFLDLPAAMKPMLQ